MSTGFDFLIYKAADEEVSVKNALPRLRELLGEPKK